MSGCADIDRSGDDVLLPTTFSSAAGVAVDKEHVTSVAFMMLAPLASVTATATTNAGSSGNDDDASDAMNEVGGTEACRSSSFAVASRSGGDNST